jgi:hypothetical protein
MKWRISSFQELEHLPDDDRRRIVREVAGPWTTFAMIARSFAIAFGCGVIPCAAMPTSLLRWPFDGIASAIVVVASTAVIYQLHLIHIRGQLLTYFEKAAKKTKLPMCLRCGYDLRGSLGELCPECGMRIPVPDPARGAPRPAEQTSPGETTRQTPRQ